jgi:exodeoxyribonuclease V alpha subunit
VTRARKLLILIGSPRKVAEMVQNQQKTVRYSCLCDMLRTMAGKELTVPPADHE